MFIVGFEKIADTKREEHDSIGATTDALIGLLPFGTTIQTAAGKRPKGHSRSGEWAHRVGGAMAGGLAGALIAGATGSRSHGLARLAGTAGGFAGERLAAKHFRKSQDKEY